MPLYNIPPNDSFGAGSRQSAMPGKPEPILADVVPPRRTIWEVLLDPKSIRWLLGIGGGLFVVGLVIWLAVQIDFTPPRVAACMIVGTLAALGTGWAMRRFTVLHLTGWAIALLACLVMPLNLWYLHANELVTIDGHLWLAALVCSVLYAATAVILSDRTFVYVMMGGVAMTGMLLLADTGNLQEIRAPVLLLTILGAIAIHAQRFFTDNDSPFDRRRFGMAFFWSGHASLAAGLLLLLGAQLTGVVLYDSVFAPWYRLFELPQPTMLLEQAGKAMALGVVALGFYVYLYSDIVVRRVGAYLYLAAGMLFWAALIAVDLLVLEVSPEVIVLVLAAIAAVVQQATRSAGQRFALARAANPLAAALALSPVALGAALYLRATYAGPHLAWPYTATWLYVAAMVLSAAVCHLGHFSGEPRRATRWLLAVAGISASCIMLASAMSLSPLAYVTATQQSLALFALLAAYVVGERIVSAKRSLPTEDAPHPATMLTRVAIAFAVLLSANVIGEMGGLHFGRIGRMLPTYVQTAFALAAAGAFFSVVAVALRDGRYLYLVTAAACGTMLNLATHYQFSELHQIALVASVGFAVVLLERLIAAFAPREASEKPAIEATVEPGSIPARVPPRVAPVNIATERRLGMCASLAGGMLASLALMAGSLQVLAQMASGQVAWNLFAPLAGLFVIAGLLAAVSRSADARRWFVFWTIAYGVLMVVTVQLLSTLGFWQKVEVFSMLTGAALLVAGHLGWMREQDDESGQVSLALGLGSLLIGIPPLLWTIAHRFGGGFAPWDIANEIALVIVGLGLLLSGVFLRVRGTTLAGGSMLLLNLLTLALYVRIPERLQTTGMILAISGGALFAGGILLSIYRDRLLALPEKIKRREGLFRILNWR